MMIRYRPLLPLFFALLCLGGALYGRLGLTKTPVHQEGFHLDATTPTRGMAPVTLETGPMYTLDLEFPGRFPLNGSVALGASLLTSEGNPVFELEDAYWHQQGTWHEEGQSGTWNEQYTRSTFNFRVAEPARYQVVIDLYESNLGSPVPMRARLLASQPRKVGSAPFFIGFLVFLVIAGVVAMRRTRVTRKVLKTLGPDSTLNVKGEAFTVVDVREHGEAGEEPGYELRLKNAYGGERYLAVETYEEEWTDSEGNDHTRKRRYMLLDASLSEGEQAMIAQNPRPNQLRLRGQTLYYDPNNSGEGTLKTTLHGQLYTSAYHARMYTPESLPQESARGTYLLEHITYKERDESEWNLVEILAWQDLEFVDIKPRPPARG
ncbi:hypothetical protein DL240_13165 [Lujinxingia litoralis]|uniref:DUF4178 domain-containing protein n=1 Tax=Lujinxingia litoralis TaxID=2211119 RepID=A0A328C8U3_9DELT|nr:hypothetical protein [Lujinxingia litoralis]RAL21796.1 hypothetical protein DL240_13165 [Lujinxingia litoralis]